MGGGLNEKVIVDERGREIIVNRQSHALKSNNKSEIPQQILFVDSESEIIKERNKTIHQFKLVCCKYYLYYDNEYHNVDNKHFWSITEFHAYIDSLAKADKKLYIVAHNFHFDFNVLCLFDYIRSRNYEIKKMSVDSQRFYITVRRDKKTICFLDSMNFYKTSISELGKMVGKEKLEYDFFADSNPEKLVEYCYRDVEILAESFIRLLKFIKEEDIGNFAVTSASLAFNSFRHKFMNTKIYIHNNIDATKLEIDSYRGGLTDIFCKGKFSGKFYKLDVNSMYPFVMSRHKYPTKLIQVIENFPVEKLSKIPEGFVWIARCDLTITKPVLALRYKKKICLVEGNITATITSAEYEAFKQYIKINKIHSIAVYKADNIFKEYVEYYYNKRLEAKARNDNTNALFYKLLMNSLYGKFGQLIRERELVSVTDLDDMLTENEKNNNESADISIVSKVGDKYLVLGKHKISYNSFPAIASFVTAYARVYLMQLILKAQEENVYYCDTDSLIVNNEGYNNLRDLIDNSELGKLKLEDTADEIEIIAPKWYKFAEKETHKGIKKDACQVSANTWKQEKWLKTLSLWKEGVTNAVVTINYYVNHSANYDKGIVTNEGRIERYKVNEVKKS